MQDDNKLLEISKSLAKEALLLDSICRSPSADDKEKERQLKKVAALAGITLGYDAEYDEKDDSRAFGDGC